MPQAFVPNLRHTPASQAYLLPNSAAAPRVDVWAAEQARRVAVSQSRNTAAPASAVDTAPVAQPCDADFYAMWHQKRVNLERLLLRRPPPMPQRVAPLPPVPMQSVAPPMPKRAAPLPPEATVVLDARPRMRQASVRSVQSDDSGHSTNSYEKMLICEGLNPVIVWPPSNPVSVRYGPPSPPLTLVTTNSSWARPASPSRVSAASGSEPSFISASPDSIARTELSMTAHTDDGKPCVVVGQDIIVGDKTYPLRFGRRGLVTYYNPKRQRQILVHLGEL